MNPEQPAPQASGNNYDFIVNPNKPVKPSGGGSPFANGMIFRIIVAVGGLMVLLWLGSFLMNMFFGDKTKVDDLVHLTQTQTEIVRVADKGETTRDQTVRNASVNIRLILTTDRHELTTFLAKHGRKVGTKELAAKKNKTTDTRLTRATQTSTFDETYADVLKELLTAYSTEIKTAHGRAFGKTEKTLLNKHYEQAQILLKQLPQ